MPGFKEARQVYIVNAPRNAFLMYFYVPLMRLAKQYTELARVISSLHGNSFALMLDLLQCSNCVNEKSFFICADVSKYDSSQGPYIHQGTFNAMVRWLNDLGMTNYDYFGVTYLEGLIQGILKSNVDFAVEVKNDKDQYGSELQGLYTGLNSMSTGSILTTLLNTILNISLGGDITNTVIIPNKSMNVVLSSYVGDDSVTYVSRDGENEDFSIKNIKEEVSKVASSHGFTVHPHKSQVSPNVEFLKIEIYRGYLVNPNIRNFENERKLEELGPVSRSKSIIEYLRLRVSRGALSKPLWRFAVFSFFIYRDLITWHGKVRIKKPVPLGVLFDPLLSGLAPDGHMLLTGASLAWYLKMKNLIDDINDAHDEYIGMVKIDRTNVLEELESSGALNESQNFIKSLLNPQTLELSERLVKRWPQDSVVYKQRYSNAPGRILKAVNDSISERFKKPILQKEIKRTDKNYFKINYPYIWSDIQIKSIMKPSELVPMVLPTDSEMYRLLYHYGAGVIPLSAPLKFDPIRNAILDMTDAPIAVDTEALMNEVIKHYGDFKTVREILFIAGLDESAVARVQSTLASAYDQWALYHDVRLSGMNTAGIERVNMYRVIEESDFSLPRSSVERSVALSFSLAYFYLTGDAVSVGVM